MLARQPRVHVLDLAIRARRRRALSTNPTGRPRSSDVATTQTAWIRPPGDVGVQRVPVDPALEAARQRRRVQQRRGAHPGQLEHLAGQPQQPERRCRRRSPARSRSPLRTERQRSRNGLRLLGRGLRRDGAPATAALIPPTLVPQTISTRSPRASSAGISTDSAPASYAPRAPPPGRTSPICARVKAAARPPPRRHGPAAKSSPRLRADRRGERGVAAV